MSPSAAQGIPMLLDSLGHETAAVLTVRNQRRPGHLQTLLDAAPQGVNVVVPGDRKHVAPLLRTFEPDLAICTGFGWLLPPDALAVPRLGIMNGHPSLLPRYRGPNPFGWTLRNGDPEVGFTLHLMDAEFDTGPILGQASAPLTKDDTMKTLLDKLPGLVAQLLPGALERLEAGDRGDPQTANGASHAPLFEDEFAEIDWTKPAWEVHNQVRSWFLPTVSGIMGPLTTLAGRRVRVLRTELVEAQSDTEPGTIVELDGRTLLMQCGDGPLRLLETEPA
jgi:methionyl-tRNA formyltransferase